MSTSSLAIAHIDRGIRTRGRPLGCCWHTSGGRLIRAAEAKGRDPDEYALDFYADAPGRYPHYLIGRRGQIWSLCDETKWSATAAWKPWEKRAYRIADGVDTWREQWATDFENNAIDVPVNFYDWWTARWGRKAFASPMDLIAALSPPKGQSTPNAVYVHVEFVDAKPLTRAQIEAGAALVVDLADRWAWDLDGSQHGRWGPDYPNPVLLTHSDIGPCRRTQRGKDGLGYPFDLLPTQVDWGLVAERVQSLDPPGRVAT